MSGGGRTRLGLYAAAAAYGLTQWYHPAHDPDLGWHLVGGAWISAAHRVPSADFVNSFNPYWHDYHWLAQVALFQLYRLGGYELLRAALGVTMAVLAAVVMGIILLRLPRRPPVVIALAIFLGAMELIGAVTAVRPQMLSVLLLALALRRLLQRPTSWELPYLFALTVLAANIHVYWIFVPVLWFAYRCVPRLLRQRTLSAASAWGGLALLGGAGLVSPYGLLPVDAPPAFALMNYALIYELLTMPSALKETIHEFKSALAADAPIPLLMVVYVALMARTFRWRRSAAELPSALLAGLGVLLAIGSLKFVSVFALFSLPYVVGQVGVPSARRLPRWLATGSGLEPLLVGILLLTSLAHAAWYFPWTAPNDEYIHDWQPVDACRQIAHLELPPPKHGHYRVLTHFNHGGWCRWAIYQENPAADFRVTTDGRTQGVPPQHYLDAYDVYNVRNAGLATLQRWNPDVLVVPKSTALANFLAMATGDYRLVYQDDNFAVFVPTR
jgi:hypothetical protein